MELTRDDLASALEAVQTAATAQGDVRVELARLSGLLENLTTKIDLHVSRIDNEQREQARHLADVNQRVTLLERSYWKAAGAVGVLGIAAGAAGTYLAG